MTNLNLAGLVLALLFIALILTKKDKQLRDYILAFFIFPPGSFLLIKYVFKNELVQSSPATICRIKRHTNSATGLLDGNEILGYQVLEGIIILEYDL